jgi:pullulanase
VWSDISVYELHIRDFRWGGRGQVKRPRRALSPRRPRSATDPSVPPALRGKYRAFSPAHIAAAAAAGSGAGGGAAGGNSGGGGGGSSGVSGGGGHGRGALNAPTAGAPTHGLAHLAALRAAGLTHVHLLPSYDFGSVPEREEEQKAMAVSGRLL